MPRNGKLRAARTGEQTKCLSAVPLPRSASRAPIGAQERLNRLHDFGVPEQGDDANAKDSGQSGFAADRQKRGWFAICETLSTANRKDRSLGSGAVGGVRGARNLALW